MTEFQKMLTFTKIHIFVTLNNSEHTPLSAAYFEVCDAITTQFSQDFTTLLLDMRGFIYTWLKDAL